MNNLTAANLAQLEGLSEDTFVRAVVGLWLTGFLEQRVTITSGLRTYDEQAALYAAWQAGQNPFPAARPGTSKHEKGLAIDIREGGKPLVNRIFVDLCGFKWLGERDRVHYER